MRIARSWLTVFGLALTLFGAGLGTWAVWVSPDGAIEIGVTRFAGDTKQENLALPAVQNLLHQSHLAALGFIFIAAGTVVQIIAEMRRRH